MHVNFIGKGVKAIAIVSVVVDQLHGNLVVPNLRHVTVKNNHSITEIGLGISLDGFVVDHEVGYIRAIKVKEKWGVARRWYFREVKVDHCLAKVLVSLWNGK